MNTNEMFEKNRGYYLNILRHYLDLEPDAMPIGGDLTEHGREGIDYAIEKIGFTDLENNIVIASFGHKMTRTEIATLLGVSENAVTITINKFKRYIKCTPYYMYLLRGSYEGEHFHKSISSIIYKQQNIMKQGGYGDYIDEISNLDVRLMQLYGLSEDSAERCLKNGILKIGDIYHIVNGEQEDFRKLVKDKSERAAIVSFFDSLHMM